MYIYYEILVKNITFKSKIINNLNKFKSKLNNL